MFNDLTITQLKTILDQAHSAVVLLGPSPTFDQVASATAFYLALKDLKAEVSFCSPNPIDSQDLLAIGEIKQKLGNKDLSISFDYSETAVDKVSYHIDEEQGKFYLVVKPQKGHKPLDPKSVSFDLTGAQADVVFLFGVHSYSMLEQLYENHSDVYENATVVTVHNFEPEIGDFKIDISGRSCWSESTLALIERLGLELTDEGATNLLQAIDQATDWLTSFSATADTFESVAKLLRAGGKRTRKPIPQEPKSAPIGFVPASEVLMERVSKTPFEAALEKARERKQVDQSETEVSIQKLKKNSPPSHPLMEQKSKKKSRNQVDQNFQTNQNSQNAMRDKNFVPDNQGRRI